MIRMPRFFKKIPGDAGNISASGTNFLPIYILVFRLRINAARLHPVCQEEVVILRKNIILYIISFRSLDEQVALRDARQIALAVNLQLDLFLAGNNQGSMVRAAAPRPIRVSSFALSSTFWASPNKSSR